MNHPSFVYFCTYLYKANKDGVVPVLLGFRPIPEYVKFNILWIACKERVLFNKRRHRVSSSPCLLSPGLISIHINCANFYSARKAWVGLWKKNNCLVPAFLQPPVRQTLWEWWWNILVVPDATVPQHLRCWNLEGRAPTSAAVRQVLLGSQVEQNKRAGSCFLVKIGLFCLICFKERN